MNLDRLIAEFDLGLRTVFARAYTKRAVPGDEYPEPDLTPGQKRSVIGMMRVNHSGEICAQALYQGQAITSRDPAVRQTLRSAAFEETEHLAWTERRMSELGGRKSVFNPLWYLGSLSIGLAAGCVGDRWNLGFLAETERQVEAHLDGHLALLPVADDRSRAVLLQMRSDEIKHAETAVSLGAAELPAVLRTAMRLAASVMTRVSKRI